ncbi:hypothetical protein D3C75_1013470 [compost metagenome]
MMRSPSCVNHSRCCADSCSLPSLAAWVISKVEAMAATAHLRAAMPVLLASGLSSARASAHCCSHWSWQARAMFACCGVFARWKRLLA